MLSRAAERMYWFGRYLERVESTALLLRVNTSLALDLPDASHVWDSLVKVTGDEAGFAARYTVRSEQNVVKFLAQTGSASIRASLQQARENARSSREMMPSEAWAKVNRLHNHLARHLDKAFKRQGRHGLLTHLVDSCAELRGYLAGSMSVSAPYSFIQLGRHLERADMTTRIVDIGCLSLRDTARPGLSEYGDLLWMNVLQSLSGYEMYRQHVDDRLNGADVADFLLKNPSFPRSVHHCLAQAENCCASLPRSKPPRRQLATCRRALEKAQIPEAFAAATLHQFIDDLQQAAAAAHTQITTTWFH